MEVSTADVPRIIIDAGPSLNFFALHQERLLFGTLGPLATPEQVVTEISNKARTSQERFGHAADVLRKLPDKYWLVLSDEITSDLDDAIQIITRIPTNDRIHNQQDLGEVMVVSHALVQARAGLHVTVLIDDGDGQRLAANAARIINSEREDSPTAGSITVISTIDVLTIACENAQISTKADLKALYLRIRSLDDGLMPIESTGLLKLDCWSR